MSSADLILLGLKVSIVLMVLGFGLQVSLKDAASLFLDPGRLLRSIVAMNVVMPIIAVQLALLLDLRPEIEFIIVVFALSPVPPFMPGTQIRAGGDASHVAGLLAASSVLAIVVVPVALWLLGQFVSQSFAVPVGKVAMVIGISVLAPLVAGLVVRHLKPSLAANLARPLGAVATLLLLACTVAIVVSEWHAMVGMIGDGMLAGIAAMIVLGLFVGFLLGGPSPDDRTVLALATAARHPGVPLAVAGANFADEKTLLTATLIYLLVGLLLTTPFALWRGHRHQAAAHVS